MEKEKKKNRNVKITLNFLRELKIKKTDSKIRKFNIAIFKDIAII